MKLFIISILFLFHSSLKAQDEKIVTLVVTGQGKNQEEAKKNALRSAIEQAFGTFISSKTDILNDNLIKDEIVSVSNGNIQNYQIITELSMPGGGYATSLKATVSVLKLTSFAESKGVKVDFKGGMFAMNIALQELYEANELKAWENTKEILNALLNSSFDYTIKAPENPKKINDSIWNIQLNIKVNTNNNFNNALNTVYNYLRYTSLTEGEAMNYLNLNKDVYRVDFSVSDTDFGKFYLRNESVRDEISNLLKLAFKISLHNIIIDNGIDKFSVKQNVINGSIKIDDSFNALVADHTLEYKTLLHHNGNLEYLGIWHNSRPNIYKLSNGIQGSRKGILFISGYHSGTGNYYGNAELNGFDKQVIKDPHGIDSHKDYEEFIQYKLLAPDDNWVFYRNIKYSKVDEMIKNKRNYFSFPPYVPAMSFGTLISKHLFYDLYINDVRNIDEIKKITEYKVEAKK